MKEIDFLPEWYKSGRRRQVSYRTQYIALGGVFVVMIVWNIITTHSISKAHAHFTNMATKQAEAEGTSVQLVGLKDELKVLWEKQKSLDEIDSKIDVASVLAELSFLIDKKIVLSKLEFAAEKYESEQQTNPSFHNGNVVRAVGTRLNEKKQLPLGGVRFKVTINGIAADAGDVAALIRKLEDSSYFCQVVPSFSRTFEINTTGNSLSGSRHGNTNIRDISRTKGNIHASKFEICCYLANYREL
jgi:Tfp pilus assembly protein PilN